LEFIFDAEKCIHSKRKPERQDKIMSKRYSSREKTPKWLEKKEYTQSHKIYNEDTKLRQDREAFQRQLKEKWENRE
ncbi:replication protein Rep, partial [Staphylococcus epidermidis]